MGISILSYNGRVHFGLMTDARLVPDPEQVIGYFAGEFEKLVLMTLMEDWSDDICSAGAAATMQHHHGGTDAVSATKAASKKKKSARAVKPKGTKARKSTTETSEQRLARLRALA